MTWEKLIAKVPNGDGESLTEKNELPLISVKLCGFGWIELAFCC